MSILAKIGSRLAQHLARAHDDDIHIATSRPELLLAALQKGDILLVEGSSRFSVAIKYLTQSSWSHAALFIGDAPTLLPSDERAHVLVEADINAGVRAVPLSMFAERHTRICRPVGLSKHEIDKVVAYVVARIGHKYDLKNIIDLARYLLPTPPIPNRWRRRLISLGSGDPTRAICSSLIAEAFQSVNYPILPDIAIEQSKDPGCIGCYEEILRIRHSSLFAPRDFDVSPYFQIVKPAIEHGFDPHLLKWNNVELATLPD